MGRLRTVSLILILCASGGATAVAGTDDTTSATRQPPPAPPIKYLEAGSQLFNSGDVEKLELASKYLQAADRYRDMLEPDERKTLDAYLKELSKAKAAVAAPAAPATAAAPQAATAPAQTFSRVGSDPVTASAGSAAGPNQIAPTIDTRQRARWLLHEAREQLLTGNYDVAQRKADEADALNVKWGLFDDTPAKVGEEIKKARPKAVATRAAAHGEVHDRRTAKAKLREARNAINDRHFEQAESIAIEVKGWGLSYGLFEDSPDKIASAARALRRRDKIRNTPARDQSSHGVYDMMLAESRELAKVGRLDEAEAKARQAQRMNVVPSLTSDRAETVLHEIALARQAKAQFAPGMARAPEPVVDPRSIVAEREANELLAKGDQAAATAKFVEAERLSSAEVVRPSASSAGIELAATADPAVRQSSAADPGAVPDLTAPTEPAAQQPITGEPTPAQAPATVEAAPLAVAAPVATAAPLAVAPPVAAATPLAVAAPAVAIASPMPEPAPAKPQANRGAQLLGEAQALFKNGNYADAKKFATEAKNGKFGVETQADELIAQANLAEQGGALSLYETALAALRSGDNGRARILLIEVAAAGDSLDESLREKVEGLLTKLSDEKSKQDGKSATRNVQDAEALAAQKLNAEVGTKIGEGRRLHETDPEKAIALYEQTAQAVHASGLSPDLTRPMVRRLEVAIEIAKKDKVEFERKMADKQLRAEIELKRLRILEADKAKKNKMKDLMDKAMTAYAEGKYLECEALAKRAMDVDPNELAASMLVFKAKTERRYKTDQQNRAAKEEGIATAFQQVDASSYADPELQLRGITMPKNFKDLTRDRLAMNERLEPRQDPQVLAIESKLKDRVSINVEKQPLSEAITFLQNYTGLNIVLDPKALGEEGLTSSSPVSLSVNQIPLKSILKLLLRPLGLTYKVEDHVVLITSPQTDQSQTYNKTYYVGDLVMPPDRGPQTVTPDAMMRLDPDQTRGETDANGIQTAGAFAAADPRFANSAQGIGSAKGKRPMVDLMPIMQLITTSIAPGTWNIQDGYGHEVPAAFGMGGGFGGDAGGIDNVRQPGAIVPFFLSISLIIKHTAEVHEQVADLLRQLRRLQDLQVSIEVRFITVSDTFFEQIGVDFDFQIQSDTVGKHTTFAAPNPIVSLFPISGLTTGTLTGTSTSTGGGSGSSTSTGGGTTGGGGGTTGGGGGTTGGGGGTTGGGGGGTTASGGGGSTASGGGTTGGSTSGSAAQQSYIVNPIRDHALGNNTPLIVGTQAGGLNNFSGNLNLPYTGPVSTLVQPSTFTPGSGGTFGIAFLSDLEVFLFLTAAQGDSRANVLQAPKVTTFNGAAATVFNNIVQYYVQSLTPIVGPGAVAYSPTIGLIPSGVTLTVTPVVSADRRYVRLTLSPFFNALLQLQTFTFPGGAVGGSGLGGAAAVIQTTVQLPQTDTFTITTTVTVPDGGTVLLGGVKRLSEERKEFGVPVVSKLPLLDRLFRNVGIGRTTTSAMLMVTPRIIILEEEEEKLGVPSVAF